MDNTLWFQIKVGAACLLFLALVTWVSWLYIDRAHLTNDLTTSRAQASACLVENADWKQKIIDLNDSVEKLRTDADARAKEADKAVAEAAKLSAVNDALAAELAAAKPSSKDDCKSSQDLLNNYLRKRP